MVVNSPQFIFREPPPETPCSISFLLRKAADRPVKASYCTTRCVHRPAGTTGTTLRRANVANGVPIEVYIQERWPWAISSLSSPSSPVTTKTGWIPFLESNLIQREMVIASVLVASFALLNCTFSAFRSANLPQGLSSLAPEGNWARRPSSSCWPVVALSNPRYNSGVQQPVLEKVKNNIYPRLSECGILFLIRRPNISFLNDMLSSPPYGWWFVGLSAYIVTTKRTKEGNSLLLFFSFACFTIVCNLEWMDEARQTPLSYVFVDLTVHKVQTAFPSFRSYRPIKTSQ